MTDDAYQFDLPPELIAQDPPPGRGDSRLLVVERHGATRGVRPFADLADLVEPGDLLVINDSRVLPARLWTRRADTGGRVEVLLVRPRPGAEHTWVAMARPARRLRPEQVLEVCTDDGGPTRAALVVRQRLDDGEVVVAAADGGDLPAIAEAHGAVPLPPYIRRPSDAVGAAERARRDRDRYQTVYARADEDGGGGSVAAPTAGLHFDASMLERLAGRGVTLASVRLHVGPGTFKPPSDEQLVSGRLHPEVFHLPAATGAAVAGCRARGGRVIAVGTTSLRVLATVAALDLPSTPIPGEERRFPAGGAPPPVFDGVARATAGGWDVRGTTRLFLRPPDAVTCADGLLTNFHLPGSSLLMLVAAFGGETVWREAYAAAIAARLRFYSYGDAMLMLPRAEARP
jgi:S-adenosylmethionine:tRNA ribosyltransferase-isomerase